MEHPLSLSEKSLLALCVRSGYQRLSVLAIKYSKLLANKIFISLCRKIDFEIGIIELLDFLDAAISPQTYILYSVVASSVIFLSSSSLMSGFAVLIFVLTI